MNISPLTSLVFDGKDHRAFLNRMFTHELLNLPEDHFRFAALCTHKGRVIANGLFLAQGEQTHLILPACQRAIVHETLLRFRLRDQVNIHDETRYWDLQWQGHEGLAAGEGRLQALRLLESPEATDTWADAACHAGLALISAHDREQHVPQTLNMDLAEGIHFSKGCYPGQEVVARLHYLGKPKNRTVHCIHATELPVGTEIFQPGKPTKSGGTCILAAKSGHLLCTIKTEWLQGNELSSLAAGPDQQPLSLAELPYSIQ